MPIIIEDVDDGVGNIIWGEGIVSEEEYIDILTAHLTQANDKFKKYRYSICDYSAIDKLKITLGAISQIEEECAKAAVINPDVIVAVVADQDFHFALATMANAKRNETAWENEVFRDRQEAEQWLKQRVHERFGIINPTLHSPY